MILEAIKGNKPFQEIERIVQDDPSCLHSKKDGQTPSMLAMSYVDLDNPENELKLLDLLIKHKATKIYKKLSQGYDYLNLLADRKSNANDMLSMYINHFGISPDVTSEEDVPILINFLKRKVPLDTIEVLLDNNVDVFTTRTDEEGLGVRHYISKDQGQYDLINKHLVSMLS